MTFPLHSNQSPLRPSLLVVRRRCHSVRKTTSGRTDTTRGTRHQLQQQHDRGDRRQWKLLEQ